MYTPPSWPEYLAQQLEIELSHLTLLLLARRRGEGWLALLLSQTEQRIEHLTRDLRGVRLGVVR